MRKKNGLTGNDPGAVICANVAPPSRTVLMTARMAISHRSLRRRSVVGSGTVVDVIDVGKGAAATAASVMRYASLLIMSKIGMYIAMTMPPTTTPRNAIMIGS